MSKPELPEYKCYKTVRAFKIHKILPIDHGIDGAEHVFLLMNEHHPTVRVDQAFIDKHKPTPGGYFVMDNDGYQSFSPVKAFEEEYTLLEKPNNHKTWKEIHHELYKKDLPNKMNTEIENLSSTQNTNSPKKEKQRREYFKDKWYVREDLRPEHFRTTDSLDHLNYMFNLGNCFNSRSDASEKCNAIRALMGVELIDKDRIKS